MSKVKNGKKSGKVAIIAVLLVLVILAAGCLVWVNSISKPVDPDNTELVRIEVPSGAGTEKIGNLLADAGVIDSVLNFRIKSKLVGNDGNYKAGVYEFSPSMSMDEMMKHLLEGKAAESVRFTIPEGSSVKETAEIIAATGVCTVDEFMAAASSGEFQFPFLNGIPACPTQLEGYLYPDTYDVYKTEAPRDIIMRLLTRYEQIWNEVKAVAAENPQAAGYTDHQLIIIASLIEEEAKLDNERPLVSSVIYNRLTKGMNLQFCSTVQYALGKHKERLYYSDLEVDSPYNTYKVAGLPAGPICSPGKASIEAALNPEATDYLYFVVSSAGDGSHNFAATGDDFSSYKDEYLASLAQ